MDTLLFITINILNILLFCYETNLIKKIIIGILISLPLILFILNVIISFTNLDILNIVFKMNYIQHKDFTVIFGLIFIIILPIFTFLLLINNISKINFSKNPKP